MKHQEGLWEFFISNPNANAAEPVDYLETARMSLIIRNNSEAGTSSMELL